MRLPRARAPLAWPVRSEGERKEGAADVVEMTHSFKTRRRSWLTVNRNLVKE